MSSSSHSARRSFPDSATCAVQPWRQARSAARSPGRGLRCSPGRRTRRPPRCWRACSVSSRASRLPPITGCWRCPPPGHAYWHDTAMSAAFAFHSSRGQAPRASFSEALLQGLAPDGGLYVPHHWPHLAPQDFAAATDLAAIATRLVGPFVSGDRLAPQLAAITQEAFNFPAPLVPLAADGSVALLELFHGPTAAFKDFGARFLASCFARLPPAERTLTILVATSGDTGGAVAAAFHGRPGVRVAVLYPQGLVSPTQERQLTCWGGNVTSLAVRGTFDDCQRLVKAAFLDPALRAQRTLSSANSINLARLLPQSAYYAAASLAIWRSHGERACFVIPSGNLGNAVACLWARQVGLPIGDVVLAHNANRTVPEYLASGQWQPRPSVATLASAMDVGDPSNTERLRALFPGM